MTIKEAATALLAALDAERDARNGQGHPGVFHDRELHQPSGGEFEIYSDSTDCLACASACYGTDDMVNRATGDLREAVGQKRYPWEAA